MAGLEGCPCLPAAVCRLSCAPISPSPEQPCSRHPERIPPSLAAHGEAAAAAQVHPRSCCRGCLRLCLFGIFRVVRPDEPGGAVLLLDVLLHCPAAQRTQRRGQAGGGDFE